MATGARAWNQRGDAVEDPNSEDIRALLFGLTGTNRFAIVERLDVENDQHYMQAYLRDDGTYWLEYREGDADAHFQTSSRNLGLMCQAFTMWLYRLPGWREPFDWHRWSDESALEHSDSEALDGEPTG
ncbi:hypothetical protein [Planotetraspora silvatica]|uniref:hypothetical protein n=1 Tax=Planotetraspora silvatica TaxID=234614 RepID=UPI00194E6E88|nr:hypothetical protein [Planotetraspora silvatica]